MKRLNFLHPEDVVSAIESSQGPYLHGSSQRSELKRAFFIFLAVVMVLSNTRLSLLYAASPFIESFTSTSTINTGSTTAEVDTVHNQAYLNRSSKTWNLYNGFTSDAIRDVTFPADTSTGWIVGDSGTIYKTTSSGTLWTAQTSNTTMNLYRVFFLDNSTGWAVGQNSGGTAGVILKYNGSTWSATTTDSTGANFAALRSIFMVSSTSGWAVGKSGSIYKYNSSTSAWDPVTGITDPNNSNATLSKDLYDVRLSGSNGIIAGSKTLLRTTNGGTTWTVRTWTSGEITLLLNQATYYSISNIASSPTNFYIALSAGGFVRTLVSNPIDPATTFSVNPLAPNNRVITTATGEDITHVQLITESAGWAVGANGAVLKSTNADTAATWSFQSLGVANPLSSVWGTDTNTLWITEQTGGVFHTTNGGTSWVDQHNGGAPLLYDVTMLSTTTGWAVGVQTTILKTTDGSTWRGMQPNSGANTYYGVAVQDTANVIAVGDNGAITRTTTGAAEEATPKVPPAWVTQTLSPTSATTTFYGVTYIDSTHAIAVGSGGAMYALGSGSTWNASTSGTTNTLRSVAKVSSTEAWAVGDGGTILHSIDAGATAPSVPTWTSTTTGLTGFTTNLYRVAAVDASHVWAVGNGGTIIFWNGSTWAQQTSGVTNQLLSLSMVDSSNGYSGGSNGLILQTTNGGSSWTTVASGTASPINGLSFASASTGWYADGQTKGMFTTTNSAVSWTRQYTVDVRNLTSVAAPSSSVMWAVGSAGDVITSTDGATFSQQTITSSDLNGVSAASTTQAWAVGCSAEIWATTNGSTWTQQSSGSNCLQAVKALDATHVWAVGDNGVIKFYNGTSWSSQTSGSTAVLRAVAATSASDAWAVGDGGVILHYNGTSWSSLTTGLSGFTTVLRGVTAVSSAAVWAVGDGGTIIFYNGTSWSAQTSGSTAQLTNVYFTDTSTGWVASATPSLTAAILATTNGGTTWTNQSQTTLAAFRGVAMADFTTGWAVGAGRALLKYITRYDATGTVVSTNQNSDTTVAIDTATLTATANANGQTIHYYLSNADTSAVCGNAPWQAASSGVALTFSGIDSKLYWCATLSSSSNIATPSISQISIAYTTTSTGGHHSSSGTGTTGTSTDTNTNTGCTVNCPPSGPNAPTANPPTSVSSTQIQWNFTPAKPNIESGFLLSQQQSGGTLKELVRQDTPDITFLLENNLIPNTRYADRVVQALGSTPSTPTPMPPATTRADVPASPVYTVGSDNLPTLAIAHANNPTYTEFAIHEKNTDQYLQANGTFSTTAEWRAYEKWGNPQLDAKGTALPDGRLIMLSVPTNATYVFEVKARNLEGVETAYSGVTNAVLPIEAVQKVVVQGEADSTADLLAVSTAANGQFTNLGTGMAAIHFQLHKASDSTIFVDQWVNTPLFSATNLARSTDYMVRAQSRNEAGTVTDWSPETTVVTSATTTVSAPVIFTPTTHQSIDTPSVVFSGTSSTLSTIEIDLGTHSYEVPVNAQGQWSKEISLAPGTYTAAVSALSNGMQSTSQNVPFQIVAAMTPSNQTPVPPGFIEPASGATLRASSVQLGGSASKDTTVELRFAGQTVSLPVDANGQWKTTITIDESIADGPIAAWAQSIAQDGTRSANATSSFILNRTPVAPPAAPQLQDPIVTPPTVIVSGIAPAGTSVEIRILNSTGTLVSKKTALATAPDGNWVSTATLPDGDYTVQAQTIGDGGVRSTTSATQTLSVASADQTPQTPAFTKPAEGTILTTSDVTVDGTAPAGATIEVRFATQKKTVDVQPLTTTSGAWSTSFTIDSSIADGSITAWATSIAPDGVHRSADSHRNYLLQRTVVTPPETLPVEEQKIPPPVVTTPPAENATTQNGKAPTTPETSSTGTASPAGSTTTIPAAPTSSSGSVAVPTAVPALQTSVSRALDQAGLTDLVINNIHVRDSAELPTLPLSSTIVNLSGQTTLPNADVTITAHSQPVSITVMADGGGNWSAALDLASVEPIVQHQLTVKTKLGQLETPETTLAYVTVASPHAILNALPPSIAAPLSIAASTAGAATQAFVNTVVAPTAEATKKVVVRSAAVTHDVIVKTAPQTKATLATALPIVAVVNPPVVATLPYIPFMIYHFITWLLTFLGIKKRREPWGVVYDGITKEPVALAIARLIDTQTKRIVETQVTDREGRFGFLVKPGSYRIEANKTGYHYPSKIVASTEDGSYQPVYHQEQFSVADDKQVVAMAVPMDPVNFKGIVHVSPLRTLWGKLHHYGRVLHLPIMVVGSLLALAVAVNVPSATNTLMAMGYALTTILQNFLTPAQPKPWGVVYDAHALTPVALALVDIIDTKYNKLLKSRLSDYEGRFTFLPPKGQYKLNVRKAGFKFPVPEARPIKTFKHPYHGEELTLNKDEGYIAQDIPVAADDAPHGLPQPVVAPPTVMPMSAPSPVMNEHHTASEELRLASGREVLLGKNHQANVNPSTIC